MFRAALGGRVIYPAPSALCENPGLKPRRVSQVPLCNENPCDTYPSYSQILNSRRWPGCSSHRKEQTDHTLGWKLCPVCVHAGTPRFAHQQALGVWGQGIWAVLLFWESKYASDLLQLRVTEDMFGLALWCSNIYKFSFFCQFVSQPSCCLNVQERPLVSTTAICKHFFFPSVLSEVKQFKYGQIPKTPDTMQWIK